jgi:hypothetical protein
VKSKLDSVKLDPDMQLPDVNRSNNMWKKKSMKSAPKGETSQKVINHYIKAIGGEKKLKNVKDMTLNMTAKSGGYKINITEMKKRPDKYSFVVKVPAIKRTVNQIKVNGNNVHVQGGNGKNAKLTKSQKKVLKHNAVMFPELKYISGDYQTKFAGIENDGGKKVYVVNVTDPNGTKETVHYNVKNWLKSKVITQNAQHSTVGYKNYKSVNGLMIPYTRISDTGGTGATLKEKVQSAKINSGLKDSNFD